MLCSIPLSDRKGYIFKDNTMKISAVILSAGLSSRMGKFKPLLPVGDRTVIEKTVSAFISAGITDINAVTGNRRDELQAAMKHLPVKWLPNPGFEAGMFSSVQTGVRGIRGCDAFFITPVDIPLIRPWTIKMLMNKISGGVFPSGSTVLMPLFRGTDAHPPLISASLIDGILSYDGHMGLGGFFAENASVLRIPTGDEGTDMDCDYLKDYERILSVLKNKKAPTEDECSELMSDVFRCDDKIIRHCRAVSVLSMKIADLLNLAPDEKSVLKAAALLHDICRKEKDHARAGYRTVLDMGFKAAAELILTHMEISPSPGPVSTAEILYLADKMTEEDKVLPLRDRMDMQLRKFPDPDSQKAVRKKMESAFAIEEKLLKQTGLSPEQLTGVLS